ncbi:MAG: DUF2802 domain-containing protein [Pseudomonadota bacterium]
MLDALAFTGRDLLIAVVLGTVVYLLEVVLFSRRRAAGRNQGTQADPRIDALVAEIENLRARLEQLEARPPVDSPLDRQGATYAEAMRLARDGHPPQDMAARLGISRGEAELILALVRSEP